MHDGQGLKRSQRYACACATDSAFSGFSHRKNKFGTSLVNKKQKKKKRKRKRQNQETVCGLKSAKIRFAYFIWFWLYTQRIGEGFI
jgi:hypothetical protein